MTSKAKAHGEGGSSITKSGKKKTLWFHADEAEALRVAAFEQRRSESDIIRSAVREYLGIED